MTTTGKVFSAAAITIGAGVALLFGYEVGVPVLKRWFGKSSGSSTAPGASGDLFTENGGINNPGNITNVQDEAGNWINHIYFLGERDSSGKQMRDFETPAAGYHGIFQQLGVYMGQYGLRTLRQFITRYAPPESNPTENYIAEVAGNASVDPNGDAGNWTDNDWKNVIAEISKFEQASGFVPNRSDIDAGYSMTNWKARLGVN